MHSLRLQFVLAIVLVCPALTSLRQAAAQDASSTVQTLPLPPTASVAAMLELDSESRATMGPPPRSTQPRVTLQLPLPNASLGLPVPVATQRTPYRLVSDKPSLAELALPPELLSAETQAQSAATPAALGPPTVQPPLAQVQPLPTPPPRAERPAQPSAAQSAERSQPEELPAPSASALSEPRSSVPAPGPFYAPTTPPAHFPSSLAPQPATALPADQPHNRYDQATDDKAKEQGPYFFTAPHQQPPPLVDELAYPTLYSESAFAPPPINPLPSNPWLEASPYRGKHAVPVQRPWVELWRPLYTSGIYPPAKEWFGKYNLVMPHFMVYGDFRTGAAINRNDQGDLNNLAGRLNLDMDLEITATERLHAFMGPLDRNGDFSRLDFTNKVDFVNRTDIRLDNLFFEGDAGAIWGGLTDQDAPFDLPFTFGFLPVFYQNGIWAADNVIGAACAIPSKNSPLLKWSNYDATFFWASDQVNSDAFPGDNNAAEFFGTAWFIEAYDGYIEADYAFVNDDVGGQRSYHNASVAYTRRYFYRVSNSIRYITNFGQSLPSEQRTADGHMLLLENSLISKAPNTVVPYLNFFYGQGRTQSLARAAVAGGILNNTGINFETDFLTGYPTLDATGVNATGAALGINMLGADFQHQLILELAALSANGSPQFRNAPGDQYAAGVRYQKPLSNAWIFRTDHMLGWRENAQDLRGSRVELRWKF